MKLGEMQLEAAAKEAAGNWRQFNSFAWHRSSDLKKPDDWAIIYTHHRDSGILDQSNAAAIEEALTPFTETGDVVFESHFHWAVGHIDGFSVRVFRRGRITKAFKTYHGLAKRLAQYPVLNEDDFYSREHEATIKKPARSRLEAETRVRTAQGLAKGRLRLVRHQRLCGNREQRRSGRLPDRGAASRGVRGAEVPAA